MGYFGGRMFLAYIDESGDEGNPGSSEIFIISSVYVSDAKWRECFDKIKVARGLLNKKYGLSLYDEIHTKAFLLDHGSTHGKFSPSDRRSLFMDYVDAIAALPLKSINLVISKEPYAKENILETALKYCLTRLQTDLNKNHQGDYFCLITDQGRISSIRKCARRIKQYNPVPSSINPGQQIQLPIYNFIEDPIEKDSKDSYFIQIADCISYVILLYAKRHLYTPQLSWPNRLIQNAILNYGDEILLMNKLLPVLNTQASSNNTYGVVYY